MIQSSLVGTLQWSFDLRVDQAEELRYLEK